MKTISWGFVMMRKRRARVYAALVAATALVAAACDEAVQPMDPSLDAGAITRELPDKYGLTVSGGVTTAAAPATNTGGNTRIVFWRTADPSPLNQETCATWNAANQDQQPGAALRVSQTEAGTKAITITKNVWLVGYSIFNVHMMDSSNPDQPFVQLDGRDLPGMRNSPAVYDVKPYPWRMCARIVGNTLSFKVWPTVEAEPAWGDPNYGYSMTPDPVPEGWDTDGHPGWYIGHLQPGGSSTFSNMTVGAL